MESPNSMARSNARERPASHSAVTADSGWTYSYLWKLTQQFGGVTESVTDAEAFAAMRALAKSEGMAVERDTTVDFAGLEKLIRHGTIKLDEKVVVNCTGHTFPVEAFVPSP
jgi:threonine synthase